MNTAASWPQGIVMKPMEEIIITTPRSKPSNFSHDDIDKADTKPPAAGGQSSTALERKVRPQKDQAVNCPRCNSTNTKFCYYNNYSLTQPRYFCKACRRYWTEGGSLRSIPVGGGTRKNRRSSSSSIVTSSKMPNLAPPTSSSTSNPNYSTSGSSSNSQAHDLGFPTTLSEFMNHANNPIPHMMMNHHHPTLNPSHSSSSSSSSHLSALEQIIRGGSVFYPRPPGTTMNSFMAPIQMSEPNYASFLPSGGFPFQLGDDFRFPPYTTSSLGFSLDHAAAGGGGGGRGGNDTRQENGTENHEVGEGGKILFPFEVLKRNSSAETASTSVEANATELDGDHHHHLHRNHGDDRYQLHPHQRDSSGCWGGMLGGAGSW